MSMISSAPMPGMVRQSWASGVAPSPPLGIADAAALADALGGLGACLFLVDASGKIAYANAAGHAMLGERSVVRAVDGRLVACDAHAASALKELLARYGAGDIAPGLKTDVVPLSAHDRSN